MIWLLLIPLFPALAHLVRHVWRLADSLYVDLPPDPGDDGPDPEPPLIPDSDWDRLAIWLSTQGRIPAGRS